jgi:small subunit ribosomal protein S17
MKTNVPGIYGRRKARDGVVVSDKMEKTIVVAVQSNIRHKIYKKTIRRVKKFMAHDEDGQAKMGDLVRIAEAAPISKRKRWTLVQVLETAELPEVAPESIDLDIIGEVKREEPEAPVADAPAAVPVAEMEPVQMDAAPEATEPEAETAESVQAEEPEVPAIDDAEVVQADAGPEATEPEDKPEGSLE